MYRQNVSPAVFELYQKPDAVWQIKLVALLRAQAHQVLISAIYMKKSLDRTAIDEPCVGNSEQADIDFYSFAQNKR